MEEDHAENDCTHCSDARPDGVSGAERYVVGGVSKQQHAQNGEERKSAKPHQMG